MRKNIISMAMTAALALAAISCSGGHGYRIDGTTTIPNLDGKKIYLKAIQGDDMKLIDSCEIVHGNFVMEGKFDSSAMAELYMDDQSLMPLVLEGKSKMQALICDTVMKVTGTPLNDVLYEFLHQKTKLEIEAAGLPRKENQMILNGKDEMEIRSYLQGEMDRLNREYDSLVMKYITENFDNVLSVGIFIILTNNGNPPMMNAQIDDIMSKASQQFKDNPYVKAYLKAADDNSRNLR